MSSYARAAFRAAAPKRNLGTFFRQWLDRKGAPILRTSHERRRDKVHVTIEQCQEGPAYHLEVEVELVFDDETTSKPSVKMQKKSQIFALPNRGKNQVILDPDHRLLIWHPDYGPVSQDEVSAPLTEKERAT